jgi:hypothetical protein
MTSLPMQHIDPRASVLLWSVGRRLAFALAASVVAWLLVLWAR